jgi:hypothetical protein
MKEGNFGFFVRIRNVMTCHVNTTDRWNIVAIMPLNLTRWFQQHTINAPSRISIAWFPYGHNARKNRVTIYLNSQFIIVYTCKPHMNHKYSLVTITPRIFSVPNVAFRLMRKIVTQSLRPIPPYGNQAYALYFKQSRI